VMAFLGYVVLSWWSKYSSDGGGVIVQRISSCRTEREGLIATFYFNVANYALRTWPWILAALASLVLYPAVTDHDSVYPRMVVEFLPAGLRGLMIASFFAAFMSTLSTYLNLSSAYFVNDFYRPFINKGLDDKHYIFVSRLMTLVLSALTALITYYVESIVGVFKFLVAFGSGTGLVYIVRWFWWRVNAWSEISAMVASTIMSIVVYTSFESLPYHMKLFLIISISTFVWVAVTFLTPPVPKERLLEFVSRVNPGGRGWDAFRGNGVPPSESLANSFKEWLYGSIFVLSLTLGIGKALLGYYQSAVLWGAVGIVTGISVWKSISSSVQVKST
jgi:SSS family solute:Na+ symporter